MITAALRRPVTPANAATQPARLFLVGEFNAPTAGSHAADNVGHAPQRGSGATNGACNCKWFNSDYNEKQTEDCSLFPPAGSNPAMHQPFWWAVSYRLAYQRE